MIELNETTKRLLTLEPIQQYQQMMLENMASSFPLLKSKEMAEAIIWAIQNNARIPKGKFDNNYTHQSFECDIAQILAYIKKLQPIVCPSGVFFYRHKQKDNPLSRMIQGFLKQRKVFKKQMLNSPRGSYEFEKYNLLQLLEKINANGCYGAIGAPSCLFYNIYVSSSVTTQGRSYISASILFFEALLANNVKFNSLNEIIVYITNVVREKPEHQFNDDKILNGSINKAEVFYKLMNTIDPMVWIPSDKEMTLVWDRIATLSQHDLNRLYYKSNIYSFCELPVVSNLLIRMLKKLRGPFMDPYQPPKEIQEDLDYFVSLIKEYVYYHYFYIDKLDRVEYMQRDVVAAGDTDSCIVSLDAWYRFLLDKVYDKNMHIKRAWFNLYELMERDEWDEQPKRLMYKLIEPELDYDFYTDEVMEGHRLRRMYRLIPQDVLRYAIINIMAYTCGPLLNDYIERFCKKAGSTNDERPKCIMNFKTEYFFSRMLLTANKKNYASYILLQEGHTVPNNRKARLGITGLAINKSVLSDEIKEILQNLLYEEIMTADKIDQLRIMKKLIFLEKEIVRSIQAKETKYYKPDNINAMQHYEDPLRMNGIVGAMLYNALRNSSQPAINLEERNSIYKIKLNINKRNIDIIKDKFPEIYAKLKDLFKHPILGTRMGTISFPIDEPVPDWVLYFVDINTIVNDNLKNFPIDSIGLMRLENDNVNYSNIISL